MCYCTVRYCLFKCALYCVLHWRWDIALLNMGQEIFHRGSLDSFSFQLVKYTCLFVGPKIDLRCHYKISLCQVICGYASQYWFPCRTVFNRCRVDETSLYHHSSLTIITNSRWLRVGLNRYRLDIVTYTTVITNKPSRREYFLLETKLLLY